LHQLTQSGTYFVTVGTYHKAQHFRGADRLGVLCRGRLTVAHDVDWQLEAWAVFSQHYHFVAHAPTNADKAQIRSEWLNAWMSTEVAKAFFDSRAKRSTNLASISATNIEELPNPLPPADEQRAIVVETAKLDARRAATERTIVLLKERRAALIAAAVTGRMTMHESTEENAPGAEECQDN
jgi:REP element-mobilizing transposase RayT